MINLTANKNRRVLIIDDNHSIHDDFRKILDGRESATTIETTESVLFGETVTARGPSRFESYSAFQGEQGLEMVRQALAVDKPYAMAFIDVRMPPGWDGVETTERIWAVDPALQSPGGAEGVSGVARALRGACAGLRAYCGSEASGIVSSAGQSARP